MLGDAGRVVIAGGSGFIGRALAHPLEMKGYEIAMLSRRPRVGAYAAAVWDGASSGPWQSMLEGARAVINLAGESVAASRWTPQRKKALRESRLAATRAVVAGISAAKQRPAVLVNASAVGYYGDRGDEVLEESAPPGHDFLAQLCRDWEKEAGVAQTLGVRTVTLRIGVVLGKGGGALPRMLPPFRFGLGGPLGSGRQWMPWIALDDLCALVLHAVESDLSGPVNAVAPQPARNADFARALGRALGRPAVLPAPAFALKLALGEMAPALLLSSQRALPAKALASGFRFAHPDLDETLGYLLK